MSLFSRALVLFALTAAAHVASAAEPLRKWTNPQGKSIQARLISIEGETARLQMANGDFVNVALEKFSEEDRKYLDSRKSTGEGGSTALENSSTKGDDKAGKSPTAATAAIELKRNRKWIDRRGKQISARFVRFHDGKAILMQGNKPVDVPFGDLSDADQAFLKERYEALGKADDVPPAIPTPARGTNSVASGGGATAPLPWFAQQQSTPQYNSPNNIGGAPSRVPSPPRMELPRPFTPPNLASPAARPTNTLPPNAAVGNAANQPIHSPTAVASVPAFDPLAGQTQQPIYQRQPQNITQSHITQPPVTSSTGAPRSLGSSWLESWQSQQSAPPIPRAEPEKTLQCLTCNKIIETQLKPGNKCPHCGTVIDVIVNEEGKTVERSVRATGKQIKMWVGIAILVLGLIGGAIAKLRGS